MLPKSPLKKCIKCQKCSLKKCKKKLCFVCENMRNSLKMQKCDKSYENACKNVIYCTEIFAKM